MDRTFFVVQAPTAELLQLFKPAVEPLQFPLLPSPNQGPNPERNDPYYWLSMEEEALERLRLQDEAAEAMENDDEQ